MFKVCLIVLLAAVMVCSEPYGAQKVDPPKVDPHHSQHGQQHGVHGQDQLHGQHGQQHGQQHGVHGQDQFHGQHGQQGQFGQHGHGQQNLHKQRGY